MSEKRNYKNMLEYGMGYELNRSNYKLIEPINFLMKRHGILNSSLLIF
jgi:hypothetical protein